MLTRRQQLLVAVAVVAWAQPVLLSMSLDGWDPTPPVLPTPAAEEAQQVLLCGHVSLDGWYQTRPLLATVVVVTKEWKEEEEEEVVVVALAAMTVAVVALRCTTWCHPGCQPPLQLGNYRGRKSRLLRSSRCARASASSSWTATLSPVRGFCPSTNNTVPIRYQCGRIRCTCTRLLLR